MAKSKPTKKSAPAKKATPAKKTKPAKKITKNTNKEEVEKSAKKVTKKPAKKVLSKVSKKSPKKSKSKTEDQVKEQKAALDVNIRRYGIKDLVIENPYITDAIHAQKIADFIISKMAEPVPILNVQTMALPKIQLGDRIRISSLSSFDIINADYWVVSHSLGFGETLTHTLTLRKVV